MKLGMIFASVLSFLIVGCRSTAVETAKLEDAHKKPAKPFALIGCQSSSGWVSADKADCKRPHRLCYVGPQKNVIAKIADGTVNVEEEFGLKNAKASSGVFITAEIWDLPNNVKSQKISFSSCKGNIRLAVLASAKPAPEPIDPPAEDSGLSCKHDDAKWYPVEDTSEMCADKLELCFSGDQSKVVKNVKEGVSVYDEFEVRNPVVVSASEFKVDLWDMPNEVLSKKITVKKCKK